MKHAHLISMAVVAVLALSGCDSARKALTQTKAAPDEYSVYTRAPLTLPPDYGLRPPSSQDAREADDTRTVAKRVMLGNRAVTQSAPIQAETPGTSALLARAGAHMAEPDIRTTVNRETSAYAEEDQTFMESLMFDPANTGTVVDPALETKRIQENQALGKPVNQGEVPSIEPKQKAPLEGFFDGWFK